VGGEADVWDQAGRRWKKSMICGSRELDGVMVLDEVYGSGRR
jgi:hypothetical protein